MNALVRYPARACWDLSVCGCNKRVLVSKGIHSLELTNPPSQANIMTEPQPQWDPPPIDPGAIYQAQPRTSEHEGTRDRLIVECLTMAVAFAFVILFAESQ
ncbi:hypothetical protein LY78DRAFT_661710 [Colletotrichum sublineola]|nr:hypothetical protein LY78DRAFT_661710 [Colletotrichum sublineola]